MGQINSYDTIVSLSPSACGSVVSTNGLRSYAQGDLLLFYRGQVAGYDSTNTASFGSLANLNGSGTFQFAYVNGLNGNSIFLDRTLNSVFTTGDQIIFVPQYQWANTTGTLTAASFQNGMGGILALKAEKLTLNNNLDVSAKGFAAGFSTRNMGVNCGQQGLFYPALNNGGAPKGEGIAPVFINQQNGKGQVVNAGGGGNNHNAGGGGGGSAGSGGRGGREWSGCTGNLANGGFGGNLLPPSPNALFFGGGGGSGHNNLSNYSSEGGRGGGLIILLIDTLEVISGQILANGGVGKTINSGSEGAGGGGGGGTVALALNKINGNLVIEANGGAGGIVSSGGAGPGGGGGGGFIFMPSPAALDLSSGSYSTQIIGGLAGYAATANNAYGSTNGTVGQLITGFSATALPASGGPSFSLGPDTSFCSGDSVALIAPVKGPFLWSNNSQDSIIWIKSPGTYWLRAGLINCTATDTISVSQNWGLSFSLGADTTLCQGQVLSLAAPVTGPFLWSTGSTDSVISLQSSGTYWLQAGSGSCQNTDTLRVTFASLPQFRLPPDTALCPNQTLTVNGPSGFAQYLWNDGLSQANRTITKAGSYWLTVTNAAGCSASDTLVVDSVKTNPKSIFATRDSTICEFFSVEVDLNGFTGDALWNDGSTKKYRRLSGSGLYVVQVQGPCTTLVDSLLLETVKCDTCQLAIPKAFTPNDDGLNEFFTVSPLCSLSFYKISIFDRWGKIQYTSNSIAEPWNGKRAGTLLNTGVYLYRIEYQFSTGLNRLFCSGSFLLLP